jgi:phosphoglycolate phosphatase-like HAD superfamily hydrolase
MGPSPRRAGVRALPACTSNDASRQASVVIFDLDGVLVDSEQVWDQARRDVVDAHGGTWREQATRDMLGMSSKEWPVYVAEQLGARLTPDEVNTAVVQAMLDGYRRCRAPARPSSDSPRAARSALRPHPTAR